MHCYRFIIVYIIKDIIYPLNTFSNNTNVLYTYSLYNILKYNLTLIDKINRFVDSKTKNFTNFTKWQGKFDQKRSIQINNSFVLIYIFHYCQVCPRCFFFITFSQVKNCSRCYLSQLKIDYFFTVVKT